MSTGDRLLTPDESLSLLERIRHHDSALWLYYVPSASLTEEHRARARADGAWLVLDIAQLPGDEPASIVVSAAELPGLVGRLGDGRHMAGMLAGYLLAPEALEIGREWAGIVRQDPTRN